MPRKSGRSRARALALESLERRELLAYAAPGAQFDLGNGLADGTDYRSAVDDRGRVTVVWDAPGAGGDLDVYARRYDAGGFPLGPAFLVNAGATAGDQVSPRITVADSGEFVICWWSNSQLYARRYDRGGVVQGGPQALAGTQGFAQEFEAFGLRDDGFVVYGDGFQLRWYGAGGTLTRSESVVGTVAQAGWTLVETDDPLRAVRYSDYDPSWRHGPIDSIALTWSAVKARTVGANTVYDAQVRMMVVGPGGPSSAHLLLDDVGLSDASVARNLAPRFVDSPSEVLVAWRDVQDGRPIFAASGFAARRDNGPMDFDFDDYGGHDGVPTAITALSSRDEIAVHYVTPGSTGADASYVRVWRNTGATTARFRWQPGDVIPVAAPAAGGSGSVQLQPTVGSEFWGLWSDPGASPGLHGRRFAKVDPAAFHLAATDEIRSTNDLRVDETAAVASVAVYRTGDLSSSATIRYATRGGTAEDGFDFSPRSGVLTFAPGRSDAILLIPIFVNRVPADVPGGEKTFTVEFSDPQGAAALSDPTLTVHIRDVPLDMNFFDFDSAGFWLWDSLRGWGRFSAGNPQSMLVAPDLSVYVAFSPGGLWSWDDNNKWRMLNATTPEAMALGASGVLFLDYGKNGLWTRSQAGAWAQISTLDPVKMVTAPGGALYVDFGAQGLRRWTPSTGFKLINATSPQQMVVGRNALVLDYGSAGLWGYNLSGHSWAKLDSRDARSMAADGIDVVVDFGADGLWYADEVGTWLLHGGEATAFGLSRTGGFAAFADGLWLWNEPDLQYRYATRVEANYWTKVNDSAPARVFASTAHDDVIADYGAAGLWDWDPSTGWRKINSTIPQAVSRM